MPEATIAASDADRISRAEHPVGGIVMFEARAMAETELFIAFGGGAKTGIEEYELALHSPNSVGN